MTRIIDYGDFRVVIISAEDRGKCEECGKLEELRPYGKNFQRICAKCAGKNIERTEMMMYKVWSGVRDN